MFALAKYYLSSVAPATLRLYNFFFGSLSIPIFRLKLMHRFHATLAGPSTIGYVNWPCFARGPLRPSHSGTRADGSSQQEQPVSEPTYSSPPPCIIWPLLQRQRVIMAIEPGIPKTVICRQLNLAWPAIALFFSLYLH